MRAEILSKDLLVALKTQTLAESLELNPDLALDSAENEKCKALFAELGMLDLFTHPNEPNLSVITFRYHPTHWIVGMLWSGYPKPDQNGYRVFCLPKQSTTEEMVKGIVQDVLDDYGGHSQDDRVIQLPSDWRKQN